MAQTEAIFNLRVNTGNSVNDVEAMTTAKQELNNEFTQTQGVNKFEQQLDELDKKLKEGNLTMRQQAKLIREYQTIAMQAGETSPVGDRAIKSAAELKDRLADMNQRVNLLSSDTRRLDTALEGISVGATAFQGVQSAMALAGSENEELIQTMIKLQAVQGVTNSITEITNKLQKDTLIGTQARILLEKAKNFVLYGSVASTTALAGAEGGLTVATTASTFALRAFRVALIATGIGAIVVGIGFLIANFDKLTKYVMKGYEYFNKLGTGLKVVISIMFPFIGLIYGAIKALQYFGIIESDQDMAREKRHKAHMKRVDAQLKKEKELNRQREQAFNNEQKQYDREIKLLESLGKDTTKLKIAKIQASIDYQKEKAKELAQELRMVEFMRKSSKLFAEQFGDERVTELKGLLNDSLQAIQDSETDLQTIRNESGVKASKDLDKRKEEQKKYYDELDKNLKDSLANIDKYNKEQQTLIDANIQESIDKADKQYQTEVDRQLARDEKLKAIREAYDLIIQSEFERENTALKKSYEEKQHTIDLAWANRLISDEEYNAQTKALAEKLADEEINLEKKKQEAIKAEREKAFREQTAIIEKTLDITKQFVGATSALNDLLNASDNEKLKKAKGNEKEEEKIKRRIFERDKKLRIAQAIIDTASNVLRSIANNGGIPYGLPFGALAAATGAFQIGAIAKTTFDSGSTPNTSSASPSQFTSTPRANETNLNTQQGQAQPNQKQSTVKVVVLESDITKVQQRVKVSEALSNF